MVKTKEPGRFWLGVGLLGLLANVCVSLTLAPGVSTKPRTGLQSPCRANNRRNVELRFGNGVVKEVPCSAERHKMSLSSVVATPLLEHRGDCSDGCGDGRGGGGGFRSSFGGQALETDQTIHTCSSSGSSSGSGSGVGSGEGGGVGGARELVAAVRFPSFGLRKRGRRRVQRSVKKEDTPPVYRSVLARTDLSRLPAWPVQNGLILLALDLLQLKSFAAKLEDMWGGRVGVFSPGNPNRTDPFVLFVHHRHTFWPLDPIRTLSNLLVPEGFPAHAHRGFQTVTYVMKGGMTHRDSMGVKQSYGAGQVQWLNTGRGVMHEEMWNIEDWAKTDIEIYQIWVNLPSELKMTRPRIQLAGKGGDPDTPPLPVVSPSKGTEVTVIAGELCDEISPIETMQDLSMLHVKMKPGAEPWEYYIPQGNQCFIYVRRGDLTIVPTEEGYFEGEEDRDPQIIGHRQAGFLAFDGDHARFENRGKDPLDFMLIEAEPTYENAATRGSFVMNTEQELDQAEADKYRGYFGRPWDFRLSDDEWRKSLQGAAGKRTSYTADDGSGRFR